MHRDTFSFFSNSLPCEKSLHLSKQKALNFADDKKKYDSKTKFVLERIENIVGKGEHSYYQHFLLFQWCFYKASDSQSLKVGIVLMG